MGVWVLFETILVTFTNVLIFGYPDLLFATMLFEAFHHTGLVMLLSYFISLSIFQRIIKKDFYINNNKTLIPLKDYKNKVKITLDFNLILYVKSTENYIQIFYLQNGKVKNILIRNTIKSIESELKPFGILRSQRSYLINKKQISTIEKVQNKQIIHLSKTEINIPLSASYTENFRDILL